MTQSPAAWIGASLLVWALPTASVAQDAAFYQGRQLTFAVASTAGGGFDSYGRLLARHIGRFIPGHPGGNVTNMSGAGGHLVGRYISNTAPADGTWIGLVLPGTITGALYTDKVKLQYDPARLLHLGSANSEVDMCFVRSDTGLKTLADARQREVILGSSTEGSASREQPAVLNNILGTRFRVVSGYPGTREIIMAIEKGEVSGVCAMSVQSLSLQRPEWLQNGFIRPIAQNHHQGVPELTAQGVMRATDLARTAEDRQVLELIYSQQTFRRPFVMAPGVPAARVTMLRKAFMAALHDKELRDDAAKMRLDIDPVSGEALQALVAKIYAAPAPIVARATDALVYRPPM